MNKQIRVLIADDHPIFRAGLRMTIERDPLLKLVAEARDGESALAGIHELLPDIAVLDVDMPPPDGLAVALKVREEQLPVKVIFLTLYKGRALFQAALKAGMKGFIIKDDAASEIVRCIKAVATGQSFLSPTLLDYLLSSTNGRLFLTSLLLRNGAFWRWFPNRRATKRSPHKCLPAFVRSSITARTSAPSSG